MFGFSGWYFCKNTAQRGRDWWKEVNGKGGKHMG
jgi:hypothetical protein